MSAGSEAAAVVGGTTAAPAAPSTTYSSYLELGTVLRAQHPRTDAHEELLFIIVHQAHELWFKQLIAEFAELRRALADGDTARALQCLHRSGTVFRVLIGHLDVLETMTPGQFAAFRHRLDGSGFQSAQFREIETVLGARDHDVPLRYPEGSAERKRLRAALGAPSVFDAYLSYLALGGYRVPAELLDRDVSRPLEASPELTEVLRTVYRENGVATRLAEGLVDIDQLLQEWRYRHVTMVARTIGGRSGTGGTAGAAYVRAGLFKTMFPWLWAVRN
ncbi:tryptophan 2,3-dioxygenase [Streptomyces sp. TRM43335]|uniref:Tryptophan 2,3-dioxygenase n=1 Tax=Streptomyces taklimakanensis TaxID=2569853 RepID=A0A6G2BKC8_9ACTN|nr:tryptophan 2,3-dioxygenase [Streptomyces taklimakanensis]